jgi:hypothetical protein
MVVVKFQVTILAFPRQTRRVRPVITIQADVQSYYKLFIESAISTNCILHLIANVDVNILYTAVTALSVFIRLESIKSMLFRVKFLLNDVQHPRQYVRLCCSDTHRNSLPKNTSRIL